jgi:hypothetical protein
MKYLDENGLAHLWAKIKDMTELSSEDISEIAEEVVLTSKWNNLGSTPFTTTEKNNYRLKADGEATYTTKSDTVAVIDENTVCI